MTTDSGSLPLAPPVKEFQLNHLCCQLLETADGSYSLRVGKQQHTLSEPMHSSKGAWSETFAIYLPALDCSLPPRTRSSAFIDSNQLWSIASVGLGLGYNEILAAGLALKESLSADRLYIESYEEHQELADSFRHHFSNRPSLRENHPLGSVYADICRRTAEHFALSETTLHKFINQLLIEQRIILKSRLNTETLIATNAPREKFNCILFDAFSPSSSPDLWEAHLLESMVASLPAKNCVFASYASRTVLKKILRTAGFVIHKRTGFAGKRESTFAVRAQTILPE
ncbi:MAG: hypothetical protein RL189_1531 [Pseudomonadota bacterium]|jgi:tRNA U34 5-methylaminomethyl-2-thiouridine-forming methyltransferase MnmC